MAGEPTLSETDFFYHERDDSRVPKLKRLLAALIAAEIVTTSDAVQALSELVLTGQAGKVVTVNLAGDGFQFVTPAYLTDGDKGDIVVSAGGATWSFDTGVVSAFARTILDDANGAAVRTTLGLEIGLNVQAYDSDLAALAALTTTAYGRGTNTLADAAAFRAYGGLVIGTNVQAHSANLVTIAALTPTTDNFLQAKAGAWASRTIAQVKTDLGLSGTNSGDQTSIAGITGTKAQFNTALTDGDFVFASDIGVTVQAYDADLDAVANSGIAGVWTAYTPTVAAGVGAFTTVSASGRWMKIGKTVFFSILVTITTNGTASSYFTVTAPTAGVNALDYRPFFARELASPVGVAGNAVLQPNTTTIYVQRYDGAYLGGDGFKIAINGTYEAA